MSVPEVTWRARALGHAAVHHFQRGFGLLRPEGRPGHGGGDSHLHPRHRAGARVQAPLHRAGEHDHHRHRRRLRQRGGGRRLHRAGALHPPPRSRIRCRPSSSAWRAAAWAFSSSFLCAAISCASSTASCRFLKPRPSPRCWSPAKRAARRPSCCFRPPASPPFTISSSPPSMSGRSI